MTDRPVFGIAECAMMTALTRGDRFGVISILANSAKRHWRHMRERLLHERCAGDRPLGLTVAESESGSDTLERMEAVGRQLRDEDGADVIIMGCAGMAKHRVPLQDNLGLPVIDPTQAAATMAIGAVVLEDRG
jgi:Asp/Glu/hydantoin racemase